MAWQFYSWLSHAAWCHRVETTEVLEGGIWEMKSCGKASSRFISSLNCRFHSSMPLSSELDRTNKSPSLTFHNIVFSSTHAWLSQQICNQKVSALIWSHWVLGWQSHHFPKVFNLLDLCLCFCRCFLCWFWICSVWLHKRTLFIFPLLFFFLTSSPNLGYQSWTYFFNKNYSVTPCRN